MALFSAGKSPIKFEAQAGDDGKVVLRGYDGFYPLVGIHLSRHEAAELVRQIAVALETEEA